jgi:hypothetical protein
MDLTPDMFGPNGLFSTTSLTNAINVIPNEYGRLQEIGLFGEPRGIATTTVVIERRHGKLNLLSTKTRGEPAPANERGKRDAISFVVPHIPLDDILKAEDFQGVRRFGSANEMETLQQKAMEIQESMAKKHFITWEFHRIGAMSGKVLDADGSVIHDFFETFGIAQKVVDFKLGTAGTAVRTKCLEVSRHIEDNLLGETMTGVRGMSSPEFFDKLIEHESVKDAFMYHSEATDKLGGDPRKGFKFGGITFEEYRGSAGALNSDGTTTTRRFIAAGDCRFFPEGTQETFTHHCAPGDFVETANTLGLPLYQKAEPGKMNRWIDFHAQSNPLFLCLRPEILVRGHSSD